MDGPHAETATILAVAASGKHEFSKDLRDHITVLEGLGVEGDSHAGVTVQHLGRVRADPTQPNLRQVHLIHAELFDELREVGYDVAPGDLGENVTTRGIDVLGLPRGTHLCLGDDVVLEVTGLRNPCQQINTFRPGLLKELITHDGAGEVIRKGGVMAVVVAGGVVKPGDSITTTLPTEPHDALQPV